MNTPSVSPHELPTLPWPVWAWPDVLRAGRFILDDRHLTYKYCQPGHALHVYLYGGRMELAGRIIELSPGDLTLSPGNGVTAYDLPRPGEHWCVHFRLSENPRPARSAAGQRGDSPPAAPIALPLHQSLGSDRGIAIAMISEMAGCLVKMRDPESARSGAAQAAASVSLQRLLLWLGMRSASCASQDAAPRSQLAAERAAAIVHAEYAQPLDVPALADRVGLSQNYLAACFHRRFGMTMQRFLLDVRMQHAKQLLTSTNLPVHRIGIRVGLSDPHHFNKQFRLCVGMSPSRYRALAPR